MATSSYALPKGRMIAPVTKFAMAPTVYQKQLPHAIQKGLKGNLGPFYGGVRLFGGYLEGGPSPWALRSVVLGCSYHYTENTGPLSYSARAW